MSSEALRMISDVAKLIESIVTTVALVAGGVWAVIRFGFQRSLADYPVFSVGTEECEIDAEKSWLMITVVIKNTGMRMFTPGPRGIEVSVKRYAPPFAGSYSPSGFRGEDGEFVVEDQCIIDYARNSNGGFEESYYLDHDTEYREHVAVLIRRGCLYIVEASLNTGSAAGDLILEYSCHFSKG